MRLWTYFCYSKNMNVETLVANIRSDLVQARKERNVLKSQALLILMNAIDNASAILIPDDTDATELPRRKLSIDDVKEIIKKEISEMQEASAIYKGINAEKTQELKTMIAVLKNQNESV